MSLGSFVGDLLGLEEVGDGVGNPDGGRVTGLSVGDSLGLYVGSFVGMPLGSFVGDMLGLEKVGDDDGALVGAFVTCLSVGDSLVG